VNFSSDAGLKAVRPCILLTKSIFSMFGWFAVSWGAVIACGASAEAAAAAGQPG
jgi:hypothetical protein